MSLNRPLTSDIFTNPGNGGGRADRWALKVTRAVDWFFFGILIFAPVCYGTTTPWSIDILEILLGVLLLLWIGGYLAGRSLPPLPRLFFGAALLLLAQGAWMCWNAKAVYLPDVQKLFPLHPPLPQAPGTVERSLTLSTLVRLAGLLGVVGFVADRSRFPLWRRSALLVTGSVAFLWVLFGLLQRFAGVPFIFASTPDLSPTYFATYYYHGNAGSYLILTSPCVALLAWRSFEARDFAAQRTIWAPALLLMVAGTVLNTSRAAQAITCLQLLALTTVALLHLRKARLLPRRTLFSAGLFVFLILVPVLGLGFRASAQKWSSLSESLKSNERFFAARITLRMLPDAGPFGFGPGTFQVGFPFYIEPTERADPLTAKWTGVYWRYAHNDYLQSLVEWGWVGAIPWVAIFGGGMICGLHSLLFTKAPFSLEDRALLFATLIALAGVTLHALVDFPFQIASLQLYVSFYLGVLWSAARWQPTPAPFKSNAGRTLFVQTAKVRR